MILSNRTAVKPVEGIRPDPAFDTRHSYVGRYGELVLRVPRSSMSAAKRLRQFGLKVSQCLAIVAVAFGATQGCFSHYECQGVQARCHERTSRLDCERPAGCSWGTQCAPIDCEKLTDSAECAKLPHCMVKTESTVPCQWREETLACRGLTEDTCPGTAGCEWATTACAGKVTPCGELDESQCGHSVYCSWHDTATFF